MALISRNFDFVAGQPAVADDVDTEFNDLYNALSGLKTDVVYELRASDAANPTLLVDNTGGGPLLRVQKAGVTRATFNSEGVLVSDVPQGTSPLDVLSTTVCPNLNADMVDGVEGTDLISATSTTPQEITLPTGAQPAQFGVISGESGDNPTLYVYEVDSGSGTSGAEFTWNSTANELRIGIREDGTSNFNRVSLSNTLMKMVAVDLELKGDPTANLHAATKQYVDTRKTVWSVGTFFEGALSTADKSPILFVPSHTTAAEQFRAQAVKWTHLGGSPGSSSSIRLSYRDSTGTQQAAATITLPSGATQGVTNVVDVANTDFPSVIGVDGQIRFEVVTANGHQDVSIALIGEQEVI